MGVRSTKANGLARARGEGNSVFIDLDNRDSLPPQVLAFLTRRGENPVINRKSEKRVSIPMLPPEDAGNTDAGIQEMNTDAGCVSIQNSGAAMDPEAEMDTDAGSPGPHTRGDGRPVVEAVTGGGPEGEKIWWF